MHVVVVLVVGWLGVEWCGVWLGVEWCGVWVSGCACGLWWCVVRTEEEVAGRLLSVEERVGVWCVVRSENGFGCRRFGSTKMPSQPHLATQEPSTPS